MQRRPEGDERDAGASADGAGRHLLILTQDPEGAAHWQAQLDGRGIGSLCWPAFDVLPEPDARVLEVFDGFGDPAGYRDGMAGTGAAAVSPSCDAVVMPSPAAVRQVMGALQRAGCPWPSHVLAGLPGAGSARAFASCREMLRAGQETVMVVPPPPAQDGAHLALCLLQCGPRLSAVHVLGRPDGRRDWAAVLEDAGVKVFFHAVYRVRPRSAVPHGFEATLAGLRSAGTALHWMGGATAVLHVLSGWLGTLPPDLAAWARRQTVWVPHPRLLDVARETGLGEGRVYHDRQSLIERLQSGNV